MAIQQRVSEEGSVVTDWRMMGICAGVVGFTLLGIGVALVVLAAFQPPTPVAMAAKPETRRSAILFAPQPTEPESPAVAPALPRPAEEPAPEPAIPRIEIVPPSRLPPPPPKPEREEPVPVVEEKEAAPPRPVLPLPTVSEESLLTWLRENTAEVDLRSSKDDAARLHAAANAAFKKIAPDKKYDEKANTAVVTALADVQRDMLAKRPDLAGLPFRMGADCQSSEDAKKNLVCFASQVRRAESSNRLGMTLNQTALHLRNEYSLRKAEAVPAVEQVLQAHPEVFRVGMTRLLSDTTGPQATAALVRRALFDLSTDVRTEAVEALARRPRDAVRKGLLAGMRHPWPLVSTHAAAALVALRDEQSVRELIALIETPDPGDPYVRDDGQWEVAELVRVNHLRNCQLCHPSSLHARDTLRGLIPTPGQKISPAYYASRSGDFVRADVVYLRQDFSVTLPVEDAKPWPELQRFDFVTRRRELTAEDARDLLTRRSSDRAMRHTAIVWALCALTGVDGGTTAAEWRVALERQLEDE